jgi:type I restriction enzyme S subunit
LVKVLPELAAPKIEARVCSTGSFGLLKSKAEWSRVRFGEVVENVNETESVPTEAGLERFIGLEHLEPGSLQIRTWGNVADGTTFTRRCRPGQVLFGKRRAYQRKVALAEFDAVVSGDIYVLAPKSNRLVPELLPFVCLSELFFQHAVETSAGSLSPRTNWRSLASFEFDLPPFDQQRRIAEILWGLDDDLQAWLETMNAVVGQRQSIVTDFIMSHESDIATLGDYLEEVQYGSSNKAILQPAPHLLPLLRIPNVIGGKVDFGELQWLEPTEEFQKYRLLTGDVLIVRTNGNPDYVGRTAVYEGSEFGECLFASYLIRLRPKRDKLLPHFLHEMLQSGRVKKDIRKQVKSSAGNYNLNTQGIRGLRIPLPTTEMQQELLERLTSVGKVTKAAVERAETTRTLRSAFLNSTFNMDTL